MTQIIEYVSKKQFEKIKAKFQPLIDENMKNPNFWKRDVRYWINHEFPTTEELDIIVIRGKLAISIMCEKEGQ
jgi:hypothetical protein